MPMIVRLSGPKNSFGGYDASAATVSVPFVWRAAGTSAAIAASSVSVIAADGEGCALLPPLLLPQADNASAAVATPATATDQRVLTATPDIPPPRAEMRHPALCDRCARETPPQRLRRPRRA